MKSRWLHPGASFGLFALIPVRAVCQVALCIIAVSCVGSVALCQRSGKESSLEPHEVVVHVAWSPSTLMGGELRDLSYTAAASIKPLSVDFRRDRDIASIISEYPDLRSQLTVLPGTTVIVPRTFAQELLARPALLADMSTNTICRLYKVCRVESPDEALHLLGKWAQVHVEGETELSMHAQHMYYKDYCEIADSLRHQPPMHFDLLEHNYLRISNGGCSLPLASILATVYSMEDRMDKWIEMLDSRLKDGKCNGNQRVSWLCARALAEEIRGTRPTSHDFSTRHVLAGRGWLEEATILVGLSEHTRLEAYKELVARLTNDAQFDAAHALVERARNRCSSSESAQRLEHWQQEIDQLARNDVKLLSIRTVAAQDSYWNDIRMRYRKAVSIDDHEEMERYKRLLDQSRIDP